MMRCDLVALTRAVVESQRARLENNGFEVVFTTRAAALPVNADEEAVKQAVVNLLSNAEKYSPRVREIEIDVGREGDFAVVGVSDRGVGIPSGEAGNIFDEFYRVDDTLTSEAKGAGLGLTIARKIVADHGGDIRYAAREGGGSTFRIRLPAAGEENRKEP
jgi:two-component system sensor histidine kinase BaeS